MQEKIDQISNRIELLAEPLADRRERIQTAKTFHQLRRNLQDEIIWCDERTQERNDKIVQYYCRR